ncbi:MAG: hypothetical protein AB1750_12115, partial [Chloroflexota bacterium]
MKPFPLLAFVKNITEFLTRPHASITDFATQTKSRLLAGILLVMTLVFGGLDLFYVFNVPGYEVPWYGYLFLLTAFLLNRFGKYRYASALALLMFPVVIFSNVASGESVNPPATLDLTLLSVMLGSALLSRRGLFALTVINLAGILLMPFIVPDQLPGLASIVGPASALTIATILAFVFARQRDQIEEARQLEFRANEERMQMALRAG